jgi:hypothetical protein
MIEEIHNVGGSGFVHLRDLLPTAAHFEKHRERRGTTGGREQLQLFPERNAICTHTQEAFGEKIVEKGDARGEGRKRRGRANAESVDKSWMPQMLAEKLHDEKNLAFYKFVVRTLPEDIVRDALMRALDVPQRNIRRSRGALFASIVAPQLEVRRRKRSHSSPTAT